MMAGWGASSNGRGPDRSDSSLSGGSRSNNSNQGDRGSDRTGQGPARNNVNLSGGSRRDTNAPQGDRGGSRAPSRDTAAMRTARFELARREKAALQAYESSGMNMAVDAFNDEEEGINSIGEALDRFGSWVQDRFGVNNPGGFAKSDVATGLATVGGFALGGPPGAAVANFAHSTYADRKPNMIGNAARALGIGAPGVAGMVGTAVSLADENLVDLDKVVATGPTSTNTLGSYRAPAGNTTTLGNQFPGGRQGGDNPILPVNTALASARTGTTQPAKPKPNPNTIRRTFSPLNISYAKLRGIEELL